MLMPERIEPMFLAPCGVDCFTCHRHLVGKTRCQGCFSADENKSLSCRACSIKACCEGRGLARCFECPEFPCKESKRMERNYKKYAESPIGNGRAARDEGIEAFMAAERLRWMCGACGGVITQHDHACSACGKESSCQLI